MIGFVQQLQDRVVVIVLLGSPVGWGGAGKDYAGWAGSYRGTTKRTGLCSLCLQAYHLPAPQPGGRGSPNRRDRASIFSWRPEAAPVGPIVPGNSRGEGGLLVIRGSCRSYNLHFILGIYSCFVLFPFVFPELPLVQMFLLENFSITPRREGVLPQPCFILMTPKPQRLGSHTLPHPKQKVS